MRFHPNFHPKKEAPVGGLWYEYQDDKGVGYRVNGFEMSWRRFVQKVRSQMEANGIIVNDNLESLIEDQICGRQPKGKCYYEKKAGDMVASAIHTFASIADAGATKIGLKSDLEKRARGCAGCGKRRQKLNSFTA